MKCPPTDLWLIPLYMHFSIRGTLFLRQLKLEVDLIFSGICPCSNCPSLNYSTGALSQSSKIKRKLLNTVSHSYCFSISNLSDNFKSSQKHFFFPFFFPTLVASSSHGCITEPSTSKMDQMLPRGKQQLPKVLLVKPMAVAAAALLSNTTGLAQHQ